GSGRAATVLNCGNGGPPYLTNLLCTPASSQAMTVKFDIGGGASGVTYDLLICTNLSAVGPGTNLTWNRLGSVAPCGAYIFSNQPRAGAFYALSLPAGPVFLTNFIKLT